MSNESKGAKLLLKALTKVDPQRRERQIQKILSTALKFKKGFDYLDFTNLPSKGDLKKFKGNESARFVEGFVKNDNEIRVILNNGHIITTTAEAVNDMSADEVLEKAKLVGNVLKAK